MNGSRAALIFLLSGCAGLAACGDPAPEPGTSAEAPAKPAGPKLASPGVNMVAAVPAGKSARFVGVHFALGAVPTVNQALPVEISIIPHENFASLGVRFESQEGLALMSGDVMPATKEAGAEKPLQHQLSLMPARVGVFMITATVETEGDEGTVSRVFSIPVIVEPPPAAGAATTGSPTAQPAESSSAN